MAPRWFNDIPLEIRSEVYRIFFESLEVSDHKLVYSTDHHELPGAINDSASPLNLFLSSKGLKEKAEPYFWLSSSFVHTYHLKFVCESWIYKVQFLILRFDQRRSLSRAVTIMSLHPNKKLQLLNIQENIAILDSAPCT